MAMLAFGVTQFSETKRDTLDTTVILTLIFAATFPLLTSYLKISKSSDSYKDDTTSSNEDFKAFEKSIDSLRSKVKNLEGANIGTSGADLEAVEKRTAENVLALVKDDVVQSVEETYGESIKKRIFGDFVYDEFVSTRRRLGNEIDNMARRANINLIIGILTSLGAIGTLTYIVLTTDINQENPYDLLPGLILRVSLVIFIEIFSFFFLKLYKQNISDIKYFQNEVTNVDMKLLAIRASSAEESEGKIDSELLKIIANTERNFVLQKGQTSILNEGARMENETYKEMVSIIRDFTKSKGANQTLHTTSGSCATLRV